MKSVARLLSFLFLASCGGIIPLLLEDDDEEPPPPTVVDAGAADAALGDVEVKDVADAPFFGDGSCEIAGLSCSATTRCCGAASDCRVGKCCIRSGPTSNVTLCCTSTKAPTCEAGALCCLDDQ